MNRKCNAVLLIALIVQGLVIFGQSRTLKRMWVINDEMSKTVADWKFAANRWEHVANRWEHEVITMNKIDMERLARTVLGIRCSECGCLPPGHKINCVSSNERARKYQAELSPSPSKERFLDHVETCPVCGKRKGELCLAGDKLLGEVGREVAEKMKL